ncbi:MAG: 3-oxoacyl-[acyl-carrier-protein] reductase [Thermodesulfovibrionia bacterium]|nr:3-oxoacyl-[acyl-carrier-protein] reductase [Thermodesulfovibrionia bacterium]
MKLKDKNVFITGSGQGIGKQIAIAMAKEGANVAVSDINIENAGAAAQEIRSLGRKSIAIKLDVSKQNEVIAAFETFKNEFGVLDILVNNAGITKDTLVLRMKDDDWDAVINVNLKGTFLCSREAIKLMVKQQHGNIISMSSVVAFTGNPGQVNYSASKAGIVGLTKTIAKEYASRGIKANAVAPGFIQTAMTEAIPEKIREEMKKNIPLGYFGAPEDVANAVIFLASSDADYITGQVLHINGGMYM